MKNIKREGEFSFSSTQLNLEKEDKKEILEFNKSFIAEEDLVEWGLESTPHITVKYGLHTNDARDLNELVKCHMPVKVFLGKTNVFESDEYDVVVFDVISKQIRELNKKIKNSLECTDTFKTYIPHMTIAYVRKGEGAKYKNNETFYGKVFTFDKLVFSPSEGEDSIMYFENIDITGE